MFSAKHLLLALPLVACSTDLVSLDSDAVDSQEQEIVGGTRTSEYPAVAHISIRSTTGESFACSSTLISPRVLLTASHCIDTEQGEAEAITAYFGADVTGSDPDFIEEIPAEDWFYFENWSFNGDDIALVLLEHDSSVEPMPFNTQVLNNNAIGAPLHVVGWGNTSVGVGSGRKRHMTTPIEGFRNSLVLSYGTADANTCQGDSGGPGFLTIGGVERVSSITSFGVGECRGLSGATRVAQYSGLIQNFIDTRDIPQPPNLEFVTPQDGAEVSPGFQVHVEASDNTKLENIEIYINGQLEADLLGRLPPFVISTPSLPDGAVQIEARAYDNRGDVTVKTVNVTVDSTCDGPQDCQELFVCTAEGVCESPDYDLGETCVGNNECASRLCATVGEDQLCTSECAPEDATSCPAGYECLAAGEVGYCWPEDEESGGCSTSGSGTSGPLSLLLALVGLVALRRRD